MENQIKAILHCRSLVWQIQFIRSELMRKFAKISAVLAAMVLALAFAGCNSSSDDDGSSSTKNILAGKTYYSIDFEKVDYTSESNNEAKIRVGMFAFDSNGQKVKFTGLEYNFKNGAVDENKDNIIESDEFNYSVSGSTLTIKELGNLIATIKSDGSIDGMKELKGNLYAFAEAKVDNKRIRAKAHIVIVNGASCTYEEHIYQSNLNQEDPWTLNGTVSGSTLKFIYEEETVLGSLSDEKIVIDTPEGGLTLKRMCFN